MKSILYIGNALQNQGKTISTVDALGELLETFCIVNRASEKQNKVLRLLDMLYTVWFRRHKTDIVLIDTYSTTNFYYAFFVSQLCRLLKLPYIPILHGGQLENRLKFHPKKSELLFSYAKQLVAPSGFLQSVFQRYGYKQVIHVPNSIELSRYPLIQKRNFSSIQLLWVRSFSQIYNPKLALQVLKSLKEKGYNAELTMVGPENDGTLEECKQVAYQNELKVKFTGLLTKDQWIKLSERCNIFINTTNIDNTPVSVIEAMALGLPVVSTNVGGIPYLIKDKVDGLLVPPSEIGDMVDAIITVKENSSLRSQLILNARRKVEQFDWEVVKTQWQMLLS